MKRWEIWLAVLPTVAVVFFWLVLPWIRTNSKPTGWPAEHEIVLVFGISAETSEGNKLILVGQFNQFFVMEADEIDIWDTWDSADYNVYTRDRTGEFHYVFPDPVGDCGEFQIDRGLSLWPPGIYQQAKLEILFPAQWAIRGGIPQPTCWPTPVNSYPSAQSA